MSVTHYFKGGVGAAGGWYNPPAMAPTRRRPRGPDDPVKVVLQCPRCPDELQPEDHEGVPIARCIRCGGAWLDEGRLRQLLLLPPPREPRPLPALRPPDRTRRHVRCPKCGGTMVRFEYGDDSGVEIDRCTGHGMWFDRGELEHVERYAREKERSRRGKGPGGLLGFFRRLFGRA